MPPSRIIAALLLLVSTIATGMLVYQHFTGSSLPGCAPDGACAQAAASFWGKVPGTAVPVSFVGLAYYLGLLLAYLASRGNLGAMRWLVRLGAAASLFFTVIMLANLDEYLCRYCIIGHAAHFGFWGIMEWTSRKTSPTAAQAPASMTMPAATWAGAFIVTVATLLISNAVRAGHIEAEAEQDLESSTQQIIEAANEQGFVGRYVRGPAQAKIRVVIFTDYQCPDCKRLESELEAALAQRDDMSLSIKHYPLDAACNPYISRRMHPNACHAARAAEAAGILGGEAGFWKMHDWLFEHSGSFTELQLRRAVREFGFDLLEFLDLMRGPETLDRVRADAEEAQQYGIMGTPLAFINGVELRGWGAENAIPRTLDRIAAASAPAEHSDDEPPSAFEKYINDWRQSTFQPQLRPTTPQRTIGASEPLVQIDVWGDYHYAPVAAFDAELRRIMAERDDIAYTFRLYPMQSECNPKFSRTMSPHGCRAAEAAEAAAQLYGREGFALMHEWLMSSAENFSDEILRSAAARMGFDPQRLLDEMDSPAVRAALLRDIQQASDAYIRMSPYIFINGRWLPRWELEGHDVLRTVIEEAAAEAAAHERT